MEIKVLGPVEATVDDVPVELGGPRQRAVLALLAAADGAVVSTADLVAEIWGAADAGTSASLRSYLSRLRRLLDPAAARGSAVISRVGHGYALRVPDGSLDARRFAAAAAAGEAARGSGGAAAARHLLEEALREWRGAPFADLDHGPRLRAAAAHLEEARRVATESLLAVRLDLGEHAAILADLDAHARAHPASEHAWSMLATALYRSGRQADALAALQSARTELAELYGLDPTHDLRRLETAILRHDPALAAPTRTAAVVADAPAAEPPPLPLTTFVGRRAEMSRLRDLLDAHRLVTLLGGGGAGKTRLAIESLQRATTAATSAPDVCWVALGSLRDAGLVPQAVADAVGVTTLATDASTRSLAPALRDREVLLVLDNCEHLVEPVAALVAELLGACPGVRVLATSREELRVPGEAVLEVRPLPVDGDGGDDGEAVQLFCLRASQHLPAEVLRGEGPALVRSICAALDGVPLAIELAAARLRTMSLAQLLDGLDDRFAILTNGPRSGLSHHRTLRETVAWSYTLLGEQEQEAFRRLAVFEGFALADAAALLGADAAGVVHELAAKSLLVVDRRPDEPRWCMLETLRAYAAEVTPPTEADDTAGRHLDWVEQLASAAAPHLRGPDAARWIARLDTEQANIRRALTWALQEGRPLVAGRIVAALPWYWYRRGHTAEGRTWLELVLAHVLDDERLRARLLHGMATLAYLDGDVERVNSALEEAVALVERAPDPELRSRLCGHLGYFRAASGDLPGAVEIAREGLQLAVDAQLPAAQAEALMTLGQLARFSDLDEADRLLRRSMELADAHDETWVSVSSGWIAAKVALSTGRPARATRLSASVVVVMASQRDDTAVLAGLQTLAGAVAAGGDGPLGARLLGAVDALGRRIGYLPARMDPLDSTWIRQLVVDAGPDGVYETSYAAGQHLGMQEVVDIAACALREADDSDADDPDLAAPVGSPR